MAEKRLGRRLLENSACVLVPVVIVNGIIAVMPDIILRDRYGDIYGIFQLGLAVIAVVAFGATARWLEGID